ncbi:Pentatricopeptide repeat-containing protein, chloroplastic [Quillaja saponaria]|uniref:Pentatricopeptide repeat-containing protein, chloroplastic n=1 Tax=Quillaja saponaria TaxID=32244 RepID=A0AAD7PM82_QUISA|nr:Pentatricopeptide repeat-containing protein, chloroplastic [Quillaja saponaria]
MASLHEFVPLTELGSLLSSSSSIERYPVYVHRSYVGFPLKFCSRVATRICNHKVPSFVVTKPRRTRGFRLFNSVELDYFLTSDDEEEMGEGFFEAIEELERMTREPSDVLEEMNDRLTARELQLVLVYFSQEGRDSWCALEVFDWLRKENRVDKETMELMVALMCGWVKKLIQEEHLVGDVVDLLVDMDCVGLKPSFSMMEKVISLYWEIGERRRAIMFVEEVLRRGLAAGTEDDGEGHKGGPTGYLAWKMMVEGNYRGAVSLVIRLRESGLKPELYSYLIAMTAVVKELNEFAKSLRKLKGFARAGLIAELDEENVKLVERYQSDLLGDGVRLSNWVIEDGNGSLYGVVHERLLAMYICAGRGLEAERQLWEMKLVGKEADGDLYDIVLAICASQKEANAMRRLLTRIEVASSLQKKKSLSWLLRGYIKGGHFNEAAETLVKMLELGFCPEYLDRVAVLQGLRKRIQQVGNVETYLKLCKRLSDANLIGPCLLYLYIRKYKLWVVKMV